MKIKNKNLVKTGGILVIGVLLGWLLFGGSDKKAENHNHADAEVEQIWTCSMHPQIRRNEPGLCPICGMDLIPVTASEGTDPNSFQMSEDAMKLANITTMIVGSGDATKEIRLNGKVQIDERKAYSQSTHIPGRIEQIFTNFTGEKVGRGQTLATVYSPELVTAQEELLQAASIKESQPELFAAAQEKLRNWKIGQSQINQILANKKPIQRFSIRADVNGVVTKKMVDLGDYVERGMPIYEISDLSKVWVLFDLYESELTWIKEGSNIEYTVNSFPGETFKGKISFIDPLINPQTRVASARVEVNNKDGRLKPEMFASGIVKNDIGKLDSKEIVIPKSAVLWTGKRSVVYVKEGSGFNMREITLGPALGDFYLVKDGLETGEEIVSNGTFTIDAAVQLSGKPSMMNPEGGVVVTGHEGMDMGGDKKKNETNSNIPSETEKPTKTNGKSITINQKAKNALQPIYEEYINLKDALTSDNFSDAKKAGIAMQKVISSVNMSLFSDESHEIWMKHHNNLKVALEHIPHFKNISEVRKAFQSISETMIALTNSFNPFGQTLYVQHCPMVDNNKGANWISQFEEIKNPYFGKAMLTCGETISTIK
ncbi:MAG: efflux RND transporter periplasmic adaptor subunit [Lutibacter sp.]|nr:efflux RND transporter periplasmic adaptor subunit [Lutibacter sp.]